MTNWRPLVCTVARSVARVGCMAAFGIQEAVKAMKNPVGASQKITQIQAQKAGEGRRPLQGRAVEESVSKAKRKQLEFANSPGYKHLDAQLGRF